ncbi:MAG: hypothetical protein ABH883_06850 [Candidatus Omnitrophota bacterium]
MKAIIIIFLCAVVCVAISPVTALAENKNPVEYTGNVVTGTVKTVGEAAKGTGEVALSPIQALGNTMTGKGSPDKIVTEPVEKTGETVKDAAVNTGKTITGQKE